MPIASVCPGCAHEQACGHADVTHCADRVPAAWCSCDPLRRAEAERDRYRSLALYLACQSRMVVDAPTCYECERPDGGYCAAVILEVDA